MLRHKIDRAWFSHLVRHPVRKWSGSICTTPEPTQGQQPQRRYINASVNLLSKYYYPKWRKRSKRLKHCMRAGCSKVRTLRPPAVTNPQTGPITIHCAAAS